MEAVKKSGENDHCCGTEWKRMGSKKFRCIGGGFAAWVGDDWTPGDHPNTSVHVCPCRIMKKEEKRREWVKKYLRYFEGPPEESIMVAYGMKSKSMYIQTNKNINSSIISLAGMTTADELRVTSFDDTLSVFGKSMVPIYNVIGDKFGGSLVVDNDYERRYYIPYDGLWICMDADRIPSGRNETEHLRELIFRSRFGKANIIIIGKESWAEFTQKHKLGETKFHNLKVG